MSKIKVALIFGGKSGEHEVSIVSAKSVFNALDKSKYDVFLVGIDKSGRWLLPDQTKLLAQKSNPQLVNLNANTENVVGLVPFPNERSLVSVQGQMGGVSATRFDVVVPILHGTYGEDGTIQGLLELANLPYVGAGVLGSAIGMDKDVAKRLLRDAGIPVVPFQCVRKSEFFSKPDVFIANAEKEFGYPFFIKPANAGSSVGVFKVKEKASAKKLFEKCFQYDQKILVEKAISARELEVAVLGNDKPKASIVGEIIPRHEFYSYEAKYVDENGADLKIPAVGLDSKQTEKLQNMAIKAFSVLECAGMARVDFFMDKQSGDIYLNEINTIPGFTTISMYPKLWEASGIGYSQLIDTLIELAIERHRAKNALSTDFKLE